MFLCPRISTTCMMSLVLSRVRERVMCATTLRERVYISIYDKIYRLIYMNKVEEFIKYMDREFFDIETYALFSALNEVLGKKTWEIVLRGGEYAFAEVKRRLGITERDPITLVKKLGKWLQDMGYARIEIEQTGGNEFLYYMYDTASRKGLRQIRNEKGEDAVMAHWSTVIMFAALKDMCNMKAEISHLEFAKEGTREASVEKWILSNIQETD